MPWNILGEAIPAVHGHMTTSAAQGPCAVQAPVLALLQMLLRLHRLQGHNNACCEDAAAFDADKRLATVRFGAH